MDDNITLTGTDRRFARRIGSTARGVCLARSLTVRQLDLWGFPPDTPLSENAALVVTELATNAVVHGGDGASGGDFHLRLEVPGRHGALRVEVTDAAGDRLPAPGTARPPGEWEEGGRGLVLVTAVTAGCGVIRRGTGKTVWAELSAVPVPEHSPA